MFFVLFLGFVNSLFWVTVYIDDASIDDWSSMLASSFLSKSTIEIDDPS